MTTQNSQPGLPPAEIRFYKMAGAYRALDELWTEADEFERAELVNIARTKDQNNCTWPEYGAAHDILFLAKRAGMIPVNLKKKV